MNPYQSLSLYITGESGAIAPDSALWNLALAGKSGSFGRGRAANASMDTKPSWTVGEYLSAAGRFLCKDTSANAMMAAMGARPENTREVSLSLFLEKHGAYYHPVRVVASRNNGSATFVLNGAVSGRGLALMEKEVTLLAELSSGFDRPVIPEIYAWGRTSACPGEACFFLGQWFRGFHEFHITGRGDEVVVWRPGDTDLLLPLDGMLPAYENIARILTLAYDMDAGREIYPWHHAAGDFIVDPSSEDMPVRLITVRGFDNPSGTDMPDAGPYPGLLFFLLNLTLRMRLDRIDGVGKPVFLGEPVLNAALKGFFRGLGEKGLAAPGFLKGFAEFVCRFDEEQLLGILIHIMEAWPPGASEEEIIRENLVGHCAKISALFNSRHILDFY